MTVSVDRQLGALFGLAIGDALGTTNEFKTMHAPAFPTLAKGPVRGIVGGGPFGLVPGQTTDDTQMACCLFASIRSNNGFDAADVSARYVKWRSAAFDIGGQTAQALGMVASGTAPIAAGRLTWEQSGKKAAGNGSLMRTTPIGALLCDEPERRQRASLDDSAITHFDPRCRMACAAHNAAVAAATLGETRPEALRDMALAELESAAAALAADYPADELAEATSALRDDLTLAANDDPQLYDVAVHLQNHQGFVRVAFRLAFWELLHAPTFEAAVVDAANRGGDADTNAAIVGALFGSVVGYEALPASWRDLALNAKPKGHPALGEAYHPKIFGSLR